MQDIYERARKIRVAIFDVDGVLTDGGIYIDQRGDEIKRFDVQDGQGISFLVKSGISVCFLSGRSSIAVEKRARELGVTYVYQGCKDKLKAYEDFKRVAELDDAQIACVGDDLPDVAIMARCGLSCAVSNAREEVKAVADYVCRAEGGGGAAREFVEWLLHAAGKWQSVLKRFAPGVGDRREHA